MAEIIIKNNTVTKKYDCFSNTQNEYLSMKKLSLIFKETKINSYCYRALSVYNVNHVVGYSMEFLEGETLSSLYWKSNECVLFKHAGLWLAIYINLNLNQGMVPALRDFTAHNLFICSNKDIVLLDQAFVHNKFQGVLEILTYFIARQSFEEVLNLRFNCKTIYIFLSEFLLNTGLRFSKTDFLKELKASNKRIVDKSVIFKSSKRGLIKFGVYISYNKVKFCSIFWKTLWGRS